MNTKTIIEEQLIEFHQTFECVINEKPTMPDWETRKLRLNLIYEELQELAVAFGFHRDPMLPIGKGDPEWVPNIINNTENLVEVADAIGDLQYVLVGTSVSCGISLEPVTREIHRSNMTKVWRDGKVHRRDDGKVLKPPTYSPADLEMVLLAQM